MAQQPGLATEESSPGRRSVTVVRQRYRALACRGDSPPLHGGKREIFPVEEAGQRHGWRALGPALHPRPWLASSTGPTPAPRVPPLICDLGQLPWPAPCFAPLTSAPRPHPTPQATPLCTLDQDSQPAPIALTLCPRQQTAPLTAPVICVLRSRGSTCALPLAAS